MSNPMPVKSQGPDYCGACGVDPEHYKEKIHSLTEKLEFSTLQILKLSAECDRLRKELGEAEFIAQTSLSRTHSPTLPNELLREIFSIATHLESDLVSPYWKIERPYAPWVISSQTRRSIPLVCHQWHLAGMEFLYSHIVIREPSQLFKLLDGLKGLEPNAQLYAKYVGWIRGVEFIMLRHKLDFEKEFALGACDFIYRIPRGRLRKFGLEDGQCHGRDCSNVLEIMRAGITVSQKSSEALYFPGLLSDSHSVGDDPTPSGLGDPVIDAETTTEELLDFWNLETLSFINGKWYESVRGGHDDTTFLASHVHSIRTIYANWSMWTRETEYLKLIRFAVHLDTIHILNHSSDLLGGHLGPLLKAAPSLRRLVITLGYNCDYTLGDFTKDATIHTSLEEIIFNMNCIWSYKASYAVRPIFSKIEKGCLPGLRRVVVCGPYPDGWLDSTVHEPQYERHWKFAIITCKDRGVDLVDKKGNALYLWRTKRGLKMRSERDGTESDTSSSEGEWWEISTSGFNGSTDADDELSPEDSEDSNYRYVSQPDLDYDSGSEESDS